MCVRGIYSCHIFSFFPSFLPSFVTIYVRYFESARSAAKREAGSPSQHKRLGRVGSGSGGVGGDGDMLPNGGGGSRGAGTGGGGGAVRQVGKTWKFIRSNSLPAAVNPSGGDAPTNRPNWWGDNVSFLW